MAVDGRCDNQLLNSFAAEEAGQFFNSNNSRIWRQRGSDRMRQLYHWKRRSKGIHGGVLSDYDEARIVVSAAVVVERQAVKVTTLAAATDRARWRC